MRAVIIIFTALALILGVWAMLANTCKADEVSFYNTADEYTIKIPSYFCPVHGEIRERHVLVFELDFGEENELNGKYCLKCIAQFCKDNFPQIKEINE